MSAIFLSASVPLLDRGNYHESANPFLIQCAVRELVIAAIRRYTLVWGGHPAITPMISTICDDLHLDYSNAVVLYQSKYFEDRYPTENKRFRNVVLTEAVDKDQAASLRLMRQTMLSRDDLVAAVFIGGMEGVEIEYDMFLQFHPNAQVLPVGAPGGAALALAKRLGSTESQLRDVDFARLFHSHFDAATN